MTKPASTDLYIDALGHDQRETVKRLLATVRAAAPAAEDAFSYGMPGFTFGGRPLVWVAAWKHHYSLYPVSAEQMASLAAPGDVYEAEKGTVRFPANAPLPYELVTRLVKARVAAIEAGGR